MEPASTGPFPQVKLSCEMSGKGLHQSTFLDALMPLGYDFGRGYAVGFKGG